MQNKQAKAAPDAGFTHILISGMLQKSFLCLKKNSRYIDFDQTTVLPGGVVGLYDVMIWQPE